MKAPYSKNTYSMRVGNWFHRKELAFRIWLKDIEISFIKWKIRKISAAIDKINNRFPS